MLCLVSPLLRDVKFNTSPPVIPACAGMTGGVDAAGQFRGTKKT